MEQHKALDPDLIGALNNIQQSQSQLVAAVHAISQKLDSSNGSNPYSQTQTATNYAVGQAQDKETDDVPHAEQDLALPGTSVPSTATAGPRSGFTSRIVLTYAPPPLAP